MIEIIMPVYNTGAPLQRAIDSVINQTYEDWKLWVIDDASTNPKTRSILEMYTEVLDHSQITVLKKFRNGGPSSARNTALIFIEPNSLVAYCDSDDYWGVEHLEIAATLIEREGYDLVYSNPELINEEGEKMWPNFPLYNVFEWTNLIKGNFIFTPSVVHRNGLGLFDSNLDGLEDYDYWIRAVKAGYKFHQINGCTCVCTVRTSGNNNMSKKGAAVLSKVHEKHKDFFESGNSL